MKRFMIAGALAVAALAVNGSPSHAGGFLADTFVRPFSPSTAEALDNAHKDIGKPLDGVTP